MLEICSYGPYGHTCKISPLEVGNFASFLIVSYRSCSSQAFVLSLTTPCGRILQLGAIARCHMDAQFNPPRMERYCPLSFFSLTSWNSVLGQSHRSRAQRHAATSVGRLLAVGSAAAVEAAVWAAWPTVSLKCESFTLFLSHHPCDVTCDVTGRAPPSWRRSAR